MTDTERTVCVYKYTHIFSNHSWLLSVVKISLIFSSVHRHLPSCLNIKF